MIEAYRDALFNQAFPPPEFDVKLQRVILNAITEKTSRDIDDARALSVKITWTIGFLCAAFESGFATGFDATVGPEDYSVRVIL
jgi:hypothetical protein